MPLQLLTLLASKRRGGIAHALLLKILVPICAIAVVMLAVFLPIGDEIEGEYTVMAAEANPPNIQAGAAERLVMNVVRRDSNDGERTTVEMGKAYVDASGAVPSHSSGLVQKSGQLTVGINSPTRQYADAAYVVNVHTLLTQQYQDIIDFEQSALGVGGHKAPEEYAIEQLDAKYSITDAYGRPSNDRGVWYGGVGPAVVIRDFVSGGKALDYSNKMIGFWDCFGGDSNKAYFDAMLVKNSDVKTYLSGGDVNVTYVQFRSFGGVAKGHTMPWGLAQTYIQGNSGGTIQPNLFSGKWTPTDYGAVPLTGDTRKDLEETWMLAKKYASKGRNIYWWPGVKATSQSLGVTPTNGVGTVPAKTANIFESYKNAASAQVMQDYADYTLVGILVYATK